MQYEKLQKFFIRAIFKSNEANDINTLKTVFKNKFNISLSLSSDDIKINVIC